MEDERRLWLTRLRWRLRGAWQAPAFVVVTLVEAVLLGVLPFAGEGLGVVPAFLAAGFANLAIVAVVGPLGGLVLRRRRPGLPGFVARDRAATAALLAFLAFLIVAGVAHRPEVREAEDDFAAQSQAVRRYVATHAPPEYRRNIDAADTFKPGDDLFRTCVPGPDPDRAYCVIVLTDRDPPAVRPDRDQRPNAVFSGPRSPGRAGP